VTRKGERRGAIGLVPIETACDSTFLELARRGAQQRYAELQAELATLVNQFPDLRTGAREVVRRLASRRSSV